MYRRFRSLALVFLLSSPLHSGWKDLEWYTIWPWSLKGKSLHTKPAQPPKPELKSDPVGEPYKRKDTTYVLLILHLIPICIITAIMLKKIFTKDEQKKSQDRMSPVSVSGEDPSNKDDET